MVRYFLDTYALIELVRGNKNLTKYLEQDVITSPLNLYELHYLLLRDIGKKSAVENYFFFKRFSMNFHDGNIFEASKFKMENKKRNISYVDALGYVMAREEGRKFVTGDKEFKNMENVEFISR